MKCHVCTKMVFVRACECPPTCHHCIFHDTAHLPGCTLLERMRREPEEAA